MASVLAIDDRRTMQIALRETLSPEHNVLLAANGPDALAVYRVERPDLVLLDLKLPGMRGNEVAERILSFDPQARIIVLTVVDEVREVVQLLKRGVMDFLVKPCSPETLRNAISKALALGPTPHACFDFFHSPATQQVEAEVRDAWARKEAVLLWGRPGVGKRTILSKVVNDLQLGRHISIVAIPGRAAATLRSILPRLDDSVRVICLEFHGAEHGRAVVLREAHTTVCQVRQVLDSLTSVEQRGSLFVAATVDITPLPREEEEAKGGDKLPGLARIYVPSPSQRAQELPRLLEHFARCRSNAGADDPVPRAIPTRLLAAVMTHEPRLDNVRFVKAVSIRGSLIGIEGLKGTLST